MSLTLLDEVDCPAKSAAASGPSLPLRTWPITPAVAAAGIPCTCSMPSPIHGGAGRCPWHAARAQPCGRRLRGRSLLRDSGNLQSQLRRAIVTPGKVLALNSEPVGRRRSLFADTAMPLGAMALLDVTGVRTRSRWNVCRAPIRPSWRSQEWIGSTRSPRPSNRAGISSGL